MTKKEFYLEMLGQEAIEIAHRVSKIKIFGLAEIQPGHSLSNLERLVEEYNDFLAVIEELDRVGIAILPDPSLVHSKKVKMRAMYEYSKKGKTPDKHDENCTTHSCKFNEINCTKKWFFVP